MEREALGLIETAGLVGAIEACDAAAKAAAVVVETAEVTDGTLVTIKFEGELGAVQAAADAGAAAAQKVGELIAVHVIPRPDAGLDPILPAGKFISKYRDDGAPTGKKHARRKSRDSKKIKPQKRQAFDKERYFEITDEQLQSMTVSALRQFARKLPKLGIRGREISKAPKAKLIEEIKKTLGIV